MLFFVLFALCFAEDAASEYCYKPLPSADNVLSYIKTLKDGDCDADQTETEPTIDGDVVCENKGNLCGTSEDKKVMTAICYKVESCFAASGASFQYKIANNKYTKQTFDNVECSGNPTETTKDCGYCENSEENIADVEYKCIVKNQNNDDNNGGDSTKKEYCYMDAKDKDGKVVGYNKIVKQQGSCPEGFTAKDKDPKLDGDYLCKNTLSKCPADGAELNVAVCVQFGKCPVAGSGSMKFTIKDKEVTETEYSSNNCDESSLGKESSKHKCDECNDNLNEQYKCYVKKDKDDGAFETAILLVIAFIFFLF